METLKQVAEKLQSEIEELEEKLDRADGQGIGLFHLTKSIESKRRELRMLEGAIKAPELPF